MPERESHEAGLEDLAAVAARPQLYSQMEAGLAEERSDFSKSAELTGVAGTA